MLGLAVGIINICGSAHIELRIIINTLHKEDGRPCPMA
jgi:hypothetical protein